MPDQALELAAITGAHGTQGEVRLKLFGEGAAALSRIKQLTARDSGAAYTLKKIRSDNKGGAIARLAEVTNRNDAEKLRGTVLTAAREALPALDAGEYYHADLLGLAVVTETSERTNEVVGEVIAVENFGATDILEIRKRPVPPTGIKTFMVPITRQAVIKWDTEKLVISEDFVED
jgi:16S rRNA processing protein RimM